MIISPKSLRAVLAATALAFAATSTPAPAAPVVGGYREVPEKKAVQPAAEFAVGAQSKNTPDPITLVEITKAEQQVVAGMSYRLTLKVKQGGKLREATVIVFRGLDGQFKLTSWDWVEAPAPAATPTK